MNKYEYNNINDYNKINEYNIDNSLNNNLDDNIDNDFDDNVDNNDNNIDSNPDDRDNDFDDNVDNNDNNIDSNPDDIDSNLDEYTKEYDDYNKNGCICINNLDADDWEKAWIDELGEENKKKKHWTKKTPKIHFDKIAIKDEYHEVLMEKLILDENDTVLDLGCGEGAVTTLVAEKVSKVVGIDSSEMMLDLLQQRIDYYDIDNIETKNMKIEDASVETLGNFDIVLASRSFMGIYDVKDVLININEIATKYVFLVVFGRRNWRIEKKFFKSIGKDYPDFAPYDYLFNILVNLGISPNITHFNLEGNRKYDDLEDAFIRMKWKNSLLNKEEINKIRPFLEKNLVLNKEDGKLENPLDKSDLVLIWWSKDSVNW